MARTRRKPKQRPGKAILAGFAVGALLLGLAAGWYWLRPRPDRLSFQGLAREEAARRLADQTETRLNSSPLNQAGRILAIEPGPAAPWSIVWRGISDTALILAEQTVRDFWIGLGPPLQVKTIYPDHSRLGEKVLLVSSLRGRPLVEVLLLEKEREKAAVPPPATAGPRSRKPPQNPSPTEPAPAAHPGRIAIIIDDIGNDPRAVDELLALPVPVTFSVLPFSPHGPALGARLAAAGAEVMLHLPMEPQDYPENDPGPGALFLRMNPDEIRKAFADALAAVPMARGVNNHMGSAFTASPEAMRTLLAAVAERGLYFVDSRTCPDSQGYKISRRLGLRSGERRVFLDHLESEEEVEARLAELAAAADERGYAIGIGHPYPETIAALQRALPEMAAAGYRFVPVSEALR